ncbi:Endonuclease G, mitochondrial [Trichinella spiralis]|uniref:Endonuclease G, mitochondrial n=1 Tax=Trichinella spiralis TaxID=6334 RepID=A0A0V1AUI3_TRISP|nr:Endonuclease G, mitochondrial [Trichinella spiralis]
MFLYFENEVQLQYSSNGWKLFPCSVMEKISKKYEEVYNKYFAGSKNGFSENEGKLAAERDVILCPHIYSSLNLLPIQKHLQSSHLFQCHICAQEQCRRAGTTENIQSEFLLCLGCGYQFCTDRSFHHALRHFQKAESHCLTLSLTTLEILCFRCGKFVDTGQSSQLIEVRSLVEKCKKAECSSENSSPHLEKHFAVEERNYNITFSKRKMAKNSGISLPVSGLINFGNTCYFNAVLQVLMRTKSFCLLLAKCMSDENSQLLDPESVWQYLSFYFKWDDMQPFHPVQVFMDWKSRTLCKAFLELKNASTLTRNHVLDPSNILHVLTNKAIQFRGNQQHDSHELLRYFLDELRDEELVCMKDGIKQCCELTEDEEGKEKLKAYMLCCKTTAVDQVFGGQLLQSIRCLTCNHRSYKLDPFLDLSLALQNDDCDDNDFQACNTTKAVPMSKHRMKKLKRQKKKEKRGKIRRQRVSSGTGEQQFLKDSVKNDQMNTVNNVNGDVSSLCEDMNDLTVEDKENCNDDDSGSFYLESDDGGDSSQFESDDYDELMEKLQPGPKHPVMTSSLKSVDACLNNFMIEELLTGSSKFACDNCAEISGDKDETKLSDAKKSSLIFSPPAVLTLHLKRFENNGKTNRKIYGHVVFSTELDMSRFCCRKGRRIFDSRVLYSLYGVICHSGSMYGGHYIAYVKVEDRDDASWKRFLEKVSQVETIIFDPDDVGWQTKQRRRKTPSGSANHKRSVSDGRRLSRAPTWYMLNDNITSKVPESAVLKAEAYMLFYEPCIASGASCATIAGCFGFWLGNKQENKNTTVFPYLVASAASAIDTRLPDVVPLVQAPAKPDSVAEKVDIPSRVSEIMRFGFPGFDNLRTFEDFVVSYDRKTRTVHWVLEHLTPDRMTYDPSVDRSKCMFREDESIHSYFRSTNEDYKARSGYDRGHMAAAGNHRRTQNAIDQTFLLSNMAPQVGKGFNRDKWNELEKHVRRMARKNKNVYICTGPLYLPKRDLDGKMRVTYEVIGKQHVAVPTHFFKVILVENPESRYFIECYVMPNQSIDDSIPLNKFYAPLESVERSAGFFIFSNMPRNKLISINGK